MIQQKTRTMLADEPASHAEQPFRLNGRGRYTEVLASKRRAMWISWLILLPP